MTPAGSLRGRTIVITRPTNEAAPLAARLLALGAEVLLFPTIRYADPPDPGSIETELRRLTTYDWLLLASAEAARRFVGHLDRLGVAIPARTRVGAVGDATRSAMGPFAGPILVPDRPLAAGLADLVLATGSVAGMRFLLPTSDIARDTLARRLADRGAIVTRLVLYRTVMGEAPRAVQERLLRGEVDAVTFHSPSAARNLFSLVGDRTWPREFVALSIGPTTTEALRDLGTGRVVESPRPDESSLVETLVAALAP